MIPVFTGSLLAAKKVGVTEHSGFNVYDVGGRHVIRKDCKLLNPDKAFLLSALKYHAVNSVAKQVGFSGTTPAEIYFDETCAYAFWTIVPVTGHSMHSVIHLPNYTRFPRDLCVASTHEVRSTDTNYEANISQFGSLLPQSDVFRLFTGHDDDSHFMRNMRKVTDGIIWIDYDCCFMIPPNEYVDAYLRTHKQVLTAHAGNLIGSLSGISDDCISLVANEVYGDLIRELLIQKTQAAYPDSELSGITKSVDDSLAYEQGLFVRSLKARRELFRAVF